jgi:predicted nucleic acid-binding protein
MRFIDANVFIYAILKPKPSLPAAVQQKKSAAKAIFLRVNEGEPVITTTVHLSEIANVLEDAAGLEFAIDFLTAVFSKPTIEVETVTSETYRESVHSAKKTGISINDALALLIMEERDIDEIYTFDLHFEQVNVRVVRE